MTQLTPDNSHYFMIDTGTTKSRTYLWSNSRLVLSQGYAWSTNSLPTIVDINNLPSVSLAEATSSSVDTIQTVFSGTSGYVPSGVSRSILKAQSSDGVETVYLPFTQVCTIDQNRARTLNHNFEQVTPDQLEGAGHLNDNAGVSTFNIAVGATPTGLSLTEDTGLLTGSLTAPTTDTLVIKNVQTSSNNSFEGTKLPASQIATSDAQTPSPAQYTRSHYRRMGFYNTSKFGLSTVNGDNVLPTKFVFTTTDTSVTIPSTGGPTVYGQDSSTNPNGSMNYISIMGGAAPYTVTITDITAVDASGNKISKISDILQSGLSNGIAQWPLGFCSSTSDTPYPVANSWGSGTSSWSYVVNSQQFYITSLSNGGTFTTLTSLLPVTLQLTIKVVDNTGVTALDSNTGSLPIFTIPVISAPLIPQVVPTVVSSTGALVYNDVVQTGTTYNIPLGVNNSILLSGFPYSDSGAVGFFRTDLSWWSPTLNTVNGGYNLTLTCNRALPEGGPYAPTLFERFPTQVNSGNGTYYDYIECQRLLRSFVVSGALSLSFPASPMTFVINTPVSILFQAYGGTTPYTWTIGTFNIPGISGATLNSGSQYIFSGSLTPTTDANGNLTGTFPVSYQIPVTVTDSSTPYNLQTTTILEVTFTTQDNLPLVKNPYIKPDFSFYTYTNQSLFQTSRSSFPWTNLSLTKYDYVNDYSDGVLPGGLLSQTGSTSGAAYAYTMTVQNTSPNVWASMMYKMPQGLCFALSSLTNGGYSSTGYYQIGMANLETGQESIGVYTAAGFVPLTSSSILFDTNGNRTGFTLGASGDLTLKYGDIVVGAINKLGSSTDQYWELGYHSPHFELQPALTTYAPRDNPSVLTTASGDQLSSVLGISTMVHSGQNPVSNYTTFLAALKAGVFDAATYQASPAIGSATDTLTITLTKTGYSPSVSTIAMPINEDSSSRIWVASADMWGNPSYYWLDQTGMFRTVIDSNSKTLYFGFTECDRVLLKGVFPAPTSAIFPQVYSSIVNFHLVNSDGTTHSSNTALHNNSTFVTKINSLLSIPTVALSDTYGYLGAAFNTYLDNPSSDPATYAYFMGPTASGFNATPDDTSVLTHTTLTNIDRGYRINCALDVNSLWVYLNSLTDSSANQLLASGTMLHLALVFLAVRPNISIGTYASSLDMDMLVGASGQTEAALETQYLRGKAYARVAMHVILGNGATPTSTPPLVPTAPLGSVKIYAS